MKNFLNIILMLISIWVLMIGLSFTISIIGTPPLPGNPILVHMAYWLFGPALCFMGGGIFFLCLKALQSDTKKSVKENLIHPATEKILPSVQEEIQSNTPLVEESLTHPTVEKSQPFTQEGLNSNTTPVRTNLIHHMAEESPSSAQKKSTKKTSGLEIIVLLVGLGILSAGLSIIDTYGSSTGDTALIQSVFGIVLCLVGGGIFYLSLRSLQYNSEKSNRNIRQLKSQITPSSTTKIPNKKTPTANVIIIIMLTICLFGLLMLGLFMTVLVFMFSGTISFSNPISQFALWGSIITGFALLMVIINTNNNKH